MSPDQPAEPDHAALLRGARSQADAEAALPAGLPSLGRMQELFPEFEIRGLAGRGGMGAVYRAHDPKLDREIAIKVLPDELADNPAFTERFRREARALARLQHPNILTVHDFGERDGLCYVLTEFVDGVDLRRLLSMGQLPPEEALRIVPQVCSALQHAHDHGVIHRDVKPENVLVDTRGHVRVADFGLAKLVDPKGDDAVSLTAMSQVVGTPHYMAPEQLYGRPVDHRADIFALGVMLYELLTGELPVGRFAPPSQHAGTEPRLDRIVQRALENDPERRYQRVSEVEEQLRERPSDAAGPASGRPPHPESPDPERRDPEGSASEPAEQTQPVASDNSRLAVGPLLAWLAIGVCLLAWSLSQRSTAEQKAREARSNAEWAQYEFDLETWRRQHSQGRAAATEEPRPPVIPGDQRSLDAWDRYHQDELDRWNALFDAGRRSEKSRPLRPDFSPVPEIARPQLTPSLVKLAILLAGLVLPITGFRAMGKIRRARGQLRGVALAVVTAWLPLLLVAWAILHSALDQGLQDPDTRFLAQALVAATFLVIGPGLMAWQAQSLRREARLS